MKYIELKTLLSDFIVFTPADIRNFDPHFDSRRLTEWQSKGYIQKIRQGFYRFTDSHLTDLTLYSVANKIYSPSYISLEMALSYYHLIPESVYSITSVTSNKTISFNTPTGIYTYRHIKPSLLFGTKLIPWKNQRILIGEPEKVILDYFYLNSKNNNREKINELRFSQESLHRLINWSKLTKYLRAFQNLSLVKRIRIFKEVYA